MSTKKLVIELQEPVEIKNDQGEIVIYKELTFGTIRAKHFKFIPKRLFDVAESEEGEVAGAQAMEIFNEMLPLIAALANVDQEVVDELVMSDALNIVEKISPFLEKSLGTGPT